MNPSTPNPQQSNRLLYILSFIEGGCLMATEILSAKMMAPYFGSSLFVWAAVLAITLGALAFGYYKGGGYSSSPKKIYILFSLLFFAGIWLIAMPFIAQMSLNFIYKFELFQAVILGAFSILFVPMFMMGTVSPLIIGILNDQEAGGGKIAGRIYAISTFGGIVFTFLFSFYLIPHYGVTIPSVLAGLLLFILALFFILRIGKRSHLVAVPVVVSLILIYFYQRSLNPDGMKILYEKEGMMGQILVADFEKQGKTERVLFVNRIIQTAYSNSDSNSYDYFNIVNEIVGNLPGKSDILILGLGGGVIANAAADMGHNVDAVEIDERIIDVAKEYFFLRPTVKAVKDDARRFIRFADKKYDLIVFDLFKGEETPAHVFTIESMTETAALLKESGLVLINANGYYRGDIGKGTRALYKTIRSAGLELNMMRTDTIESRSSMIYLAANTTDAFDNYIPTDWKENYLIRDSLDINDVKVLSDNKPVLDFLNAKATKAWRMAYLNYSKSFYQHPLQPLFR
jgi:spermidine synthase